MERENSWEKWESWGLIEIVGRKGERWEYVDLTRQHGISAGEDFRLQNENSTRKHERIISLSYQVSQTELYFM